MDGVPTKILLAADGTEDATHVALAAIDLSEKAASSCTKRASQRPA